MAKRVQRRRGTTAEHAGFTGHEGESTIDTTKETVVVHDGSTAGGFPLAREDMSNVVNQVGITQLKFSDGTAGQVLKTDGSGTLSFTTIDASTTAVGGDLSGTVSNAQIIANAVGIPELNVSSIILPVAISFNLVRTKAGPLPGLTCKNSITFILLPLCKITEPFFISEVFAIFYLFRSKNLKPEIFLF